MKRGFTLIELLAVIVILSIIVIIASPIVVSIIKDSKESADRRSIDEYGKAVENAVSKYLINNRQVPKNLQNIDVEYKGSSVVCEKSIIYDSGTIYLSKCKVDGNLIFDKNSKNGYYSYGKREKEYNKGDKITYKNMEWYVIDNSRDTDSVVKLMLAELLPFDIVNHYAIQTEYGHADSLGSYGRIPFYYRNDGCNSDNRTNCTSDYNFSDVKVIIDNWANDYLNVEELLDLNKDGNYARLITKEEYNTLYNSEFTWIGVDVNIWYMGYWTMTPTNNGPAVIGASGNLYEGWMLNSYSYANGPIRPVIEIYKSSIK